MEQNATSLKKTARIAGAFYLVLALTAIYGFMYVPSQIIVPGDKAATAQNILAKEFLFRSGLISHAVAHTAFLFLIVTLYRLFRRVNEYQAKLMTGLVLVSIPMAFLADAFKYVALRVFKGDLLKSLPAEQQQDMAMFCMKTGQYIGQMAVLNWGLWLIPLGWLVYRSGFMPRILGILLYVNGAAYVADWLLFFLFPDYTAVFSKVLFAMFFSGEIPFIFWLLIKGTKEEAAP